jgi:hypothetical protein
VAHFNLYNQKKRKALLALKVIASHSTKDSFKVFVPVLKDYSIIQKLGAIIANNVLTNKALCTLI